MSRCSKTGAVRRSRPALVLAFAAAFSMGCDGAASDIAMSQRSWVGDTLVTTFVPSQAAVRAELASEFPRPGSTFSEELGQLGAIAASATGALAFVDSDATQLWLVASDSSAPVPIGRAGDGPGEYRQVSALAFLSNGSIVAVDAWSGRRLVYDGSGVFISTQRIATASAPRFPSAIVAARDERIATRVSAFEVWRQQKASLHGALVVGSVEGASADTLLVPASLRAACPTVPEPRFRSGFRMDIREPFVLKVATGVTPNGDMVAGCPREYRFGVHNGMTVYRFVATRGQIVTVPSEVVDGHRARWTESKRLAGTDPNFDWSDADMVDRYPAYLEFLHDHVRRIVAVVPVATDGAGDAAAPVNPSRRRLSRPKLVFDLFDVEGGYCGRVLLPEQATYDGSLLTTPPVFRGDTVWAVLTDSTGVETIGRMHFKLEGCNVG